MRILHVCGGVGSMTASVRKDHEILGNIEDRKAYYTGTWERNHPDSSFMVQSIEEAPDLKEVDLIIGHPKCGKFSQLNCYDKKNSVTNIDLFLEGVKRYQPKFFVFDNLAKMLDVYPEEYFEMPGYNLQFVLVSNWEYGNIQKYRKRIFVIGSKTDYKFDDTLPEVEHKNILETIGDLNEEGEPEINHIPLADDDHIPYFYLYMWKLGEGKMTAKTFRENIHDWRDGSSIWTHYRNGKFRHKPGFKVMDIQQEWANTLNTGNQAYLDILGDIRLMTIRERARIQGLPDDFIFEGNFKQQGYQTGACIPNQFCTHLINQINTYLK